MQQAWLAVFRMLLSRSANFVQVTAEIERSGESFEKAPRTGSMQIIIFVVCAFVCFLVMQAALLDLQQAYDSSLEKAKKEISKVVHSFSIAISMAGVLSNFAELLCASCSLNMLFLSLFCA